MDLLNDLHHWLSALSPVTVYVVLFLIAYGENLVPPLPGDVVVVVGGMVAATGAVSLPTIIALCTVAGGLGFMTVFGVGRRFGDAALDPRRLRFLPKAELARAQAVVGRRGLWVVAINRFIPGLRSVIALAVGMSSLRAVPVSVLSTLCAGVWSALIAYLGYTLVGHRAVMARVLGGFERVGTVLLVVLVGAVIVWVVRRRRRSAIPPPDAPAA